MATDFFERQATARRNTKWLVLMFVLAVIGIVGTTFVVTAMISGMAMGPEAAHQFSENPLSIPLELPLAASAGALALIGGGSAFKIAQLAGGGTVVAERLGGRRIYPNTKDAVERRVLNVVEEMALASGVPVPPVFMLSEEQGINAFAAGFSTSDAVIGITRGCAQQLTRDQLQGVIAHEFSHILNGDMRLNLRLMGVLHGILLMGLVGQQLFRFAHFGGGRRSSNSDRDNSGMYLLLIGLAFMVLGFIGVFFGNLIKAAVSRQREYLADSSAVQFTRNPEGIAGALKRIGSAVMGSQLTSPRAAEANHMYFAEGIHGLLATHPPLPERIRRIEPQWDGKFPAPLPDDAVVGISGAGAAGLVGEEGPLFRPTVPVDVVQHAADQVGCPSEIHQRYIQELVAAMPQPVVDAAHDPYGARAVIYATLLDKNPQIRNVQLQALTTSADEPVFKLTSQLIPHADELDVRARLPLVDMTLPALRALSMSQYQEFSHCFVRLVQADNRLGLFEWTLHHVMLRHLRPQFEPVKPPRIVFDHLNQVSEPCSMLLSTLARASDGADQSAFDSATQQLSDVPLQFLPPDKCKLQYLDEALLKLSQVEPMQRQRLVDACAAAICADLEVKVAEAELLRAICDMLDCPMPPLLPGQRLTPGLRSTREPRHA